MGNHQDHTVKCQVCTEDYECRDGWYCYYELCRDCKRQLESLQPAARAMIEILLKRIVRLEKGER